MVVAQPSPPASSRVPCCSVPDIELAIEFFSNNEAWEDCTVISGAATVSVPDDGSTGSVDVCITLPISRSGLPNFEIYDVGDFTSNVLTGNFRELCKIVTYPVFNEENEATSFEVLSFYVVPVDARSGFSDIVTGISGSLATANNSCDCATGQNNLSVGFRPRKDAGGSLNDPSDDVDRTYYIPNGANLSDLITNPGSSLFFFQDPSVAGNLPTDIILEGELNVDMDYVMGTNENNSLSTLTLGDNSKITILEDYTLEIRNTEIGGCGTLWESITVEKEAAFLLSNSVVTNGLKAITVEKDGKLVVKNTEFKNNEVSIYVPEKNSESRSRQDVDINVFGSSFNFRVESGFNGQDSPFAPDPIMLNPLFGEIPRAGAEFNQVSSGGILFARNEASFKRNEFSNIANGIILDRSGGNVSGSNFQNIKSVSGQGPSGNGILITGSYRDFSSGYTEIFSEENEPNGKVSFTNMETAIRINGGRNIRIEGTTMDFVEYGVRAEEANRIRFHENEVNATQYGFFRDGYGFWGRSYVRDNVFTAGSLPNGTTEPAAIRFTESVPNVFAYHHIWDNDIVLDGAMHGLLSTSTNRLYFRTNNISWAQGKMFGTNAVSVEGGRGMEMNGNLLQGTTGEAFTETSGVTLSSIYRPVVWCNTIVNVETQISVFGNNQNGKIRGNQLLNGGVGLQYGHPVLNNSTFTGPQNHTGNKWIGPFVGFGAAYYNGDNQDFGFSRYFIDTGDDPAFLPTLNPGTSGWFLNEVNSPEPFYTCPANLPPSPVDIDGFDVVDMIVEGDYLPAGNWEADYWIADNRVLRSFRHGEVDSTQHPNWNVWRNSSKIHDITDYQTVEGLLENDFGLNSLQVLEIDSLFDEAETLQHDIALATIAKYQDPAVDTAFVDSLINAKRLSLYDNQIDFDTIFNLLDARKTQRINDAEIINNGLTGTSLPATLQQEMNTYAISISRGNLKDLAKYQAQITAIAEECPLNGGEAVYQARALAGTLGFQLTINAQENCENPSTPKSARNNAPLPKVLVYPNPAKGEINFQLPEGVTDRLVVTDLNGRAVKETVFAKTVNSGRISLPPLPSGVYVLTFYQDGNSTERQLITINK